MLPLICSAVVGELVPIPTLPFLSTMSAVDVAKTDVEVEIVKSGSVPPAAPAI
jgi:hypothetical protein